jgi:hypothetical protein
MPEAAVYEDGNTRVAENEVWATRQKGAPSPARNAHSPHEVHKPEFGCAVAAASITPHDSTP